LSFIDNRDELGSEIHIFFSFFNAFAMLFDDFLKLLTEIPYNKKNH